MAELSPSAQAVLDAYNSRWDNDLAAALCAAADQVAPEIKTPWNSTLSPIIPVGKLRAQLFAIAAELEGADKTRDWDHEHD